MIVKVKSRILIAIGVIFGLLMIFGPLMINSTLIVLLKYHMLSGTFSDWLNFSGGYYGTIFAAVFAAVFVIYQVDRNYNDQRKIERDKVRPMIDADYHVVEMTPQTKIFYDQYWAFSHGLTEEQIREYFKKKENNHYSIWILTLNVQNNQSANYIQISIPPEKEGKNAENLFIRQINSKETVCFLTTSMLDIIQHNNKILIPQNVKMNGFKISCMSNQRELCQVAFNAEPRGGAFKLSRSADSVRYTMDSLEMPDYNYHGERELKYFYF